jgi:hypothetical protein
MYGFLAVCLFVLAKWLDKKLTMKLWGGLIPLLIGLGGSMLLYASALSQTIVGWTNAVVGPLAEQIGSWIGEPLPMTVVYGVACIGGAVVTVIDLWKDHTYNPKATTALIITPIAAHGSGSGVIPMLIDQIHMAGAAMVSGFVSAGVGS